MQSPRTNRSKLCPLTRYSILTGVKRVNGSDTIYPTRSCHSTLLYPWAWTSSSPQENVPTAVSTWHTTQYATSGFTRGAHVSPFSAKTQAARRSFPVCRLTSSYSTVCTVHEFQEANTHGGTSITAVLKKKDGDVFFTTGARTLAGINQPVNGHKSMPPARDGCLLYTSSNCLS